MLNGHLNEHHQSTTSQIYLFDWFSNSTQVFTIQKVKNNSNVTSSPTKPHRSFSSHQPQHGDITLPASLADIVMPHPRVDGVRSILCGDSWWLVHDGSRRRSRKAERGASTRTRRWHHMISQHEFCFRACVVNSDTERAVRNLRRCQQQIFSPVLARQVISTYSLVEGFGLGAQML